MKYCKLCDKKHPNDLMFCPDCGSFLVRAKEGVSENIKYSEKKKTKKDMVKETPGLIEIVKKDEVKKPIKKRKRKSHKEKLEELIEEDKQRIREFEANKKLEQEREDKINRINDKNPNINIYISDENIYFLHDYIPLRKIREYREESQHLSKDVKNKIRISKKILMYKNGKDKAVELFTKEIMGAISILCIRYWDDIDGIALVSVPASKVDKPHQTTKSIDLIESWYKKDEIESIYGCDKNIHNFSHLLKRYEDLESAHLSDTKTRPTVEDHLNSILCTEEDLSNLNYGFILLDDVSTQGNTMEACKKILMDKGLNEKQILPLVIGDTATKFLTLDKDGKEIILSRDFIFTL